MDSCVTYLRFPVSHSMAPLSRLLVYYVRENGEGVTDSLQIPIQPDFENQVWKENEKEPPSIHSIYPEKSILSVLPWCINTHRDVKLMRTGSKFPNIDVVEYTVTSGFLVIIRVTTLYSIYYKPGGNGAHSVYILELSPSIHAPTQSTV